MNNTIVLVDAATNTAGANALHARCAAVCANTDIAFRVEPVQDQNELLTAVTAAAPAAGALLVAPGALSSDALATTLAQIDCEQTALIEVQRTHHSQPALRPGRQHIALVAGLEDDGYEVAVRAAAKKLGHSSYPIVAAPAQRRVLLLNGPNLNLLGTREPEVYGVDTLADIEQRCTELAGTLGLELRLEQSNHEGELVDWVQQAIGNSDAIIINAGAYTHTSVAIHDALQAYTGIKLELHISNPLLREPFRHVSFVAPAADGVVAGLGVAGYEHCLETVATLEPARPHR